MAVAMKPTGWLRPGKAAALLGVSTGALVKYAAEWGVRLRTIPGSSHRWYNHDDVLKFRAQIDAAADASVARVSKAPKDRETARTAAC